MRHIKQANKQIQNKDSVLTFYWVNDFKGNNNSVKNYYNIFPQPYLTDPHKPFNFFSFFFIFNILKPYMSYKMPTSNSFFKLVSNSMWKEGGPSYKERVSDNP